MLNPIASTDLPDVTSEVMRESTRLDALTGDYGDLRIFASGDGTRKFLRVWEGEGRQANGTVGPRWYEITAAPRGPNTK